MYVSILKTYICQYYVIIEKKFICQYYYTLILKIPTCQFCILITVKYMKSTLLRMLDARRTGKGIQANQAQVRTPVAGNQRSSRWFTWMEHTGNNLAKLEVRKLTKLAKNQIRRANLLAYSPCGKENINYLLVYVHQWSQDAVKMTEKMLQLIPQQ